MNQPKPEGDGIRPSKTRRVAEILGVDSAAINLTAVRVISLCVGPGTTYLVATRMSPKVQGVYYTFYGILALRGLLELGTTVVLQQFASHEWAHLSLDDYRGINGDARAISRLASLVRFGVLWYAISAAIFVLGVGAFGFWFFSAKPIWDVRWQAPWFALILLATPAFLTTPLVAILEGCNQYEAVSRTRLAQIIATPMVVWPAFLLEAGLWIAPLTISLQFVSELVLCCVFAEFWLALVRGAGADRIDWRREIVPFHATLFGNGVVYFLHVSIYAPVVFRYVSAEAAGKIGMTLSLSRVVQGVAQALFAPKTPRFGALVAKGRFADLDSLFFRITAVSLGAALAGALLMQTSVSILNVYHFAIVRRILDPLLVSGILLSMLGDQWLNCLNPYLLSHKRNPTWLATTASGLVNGLLVITLTRAIGVAGAVVANIIVVWCLQVPIHTLIWRTCRARWHGGRSRLAFYKYNTGAVSVEQQ